jgi:hypothetical protein
MKKQSGQTLIELLLTIGIATIVIPALFAGLIVTRSGRPQQEQRLKAVSILTETKEAVRNIREKGWVTFAVNGTYHPVLSGASWTFSSGAETLASGFVRQVVLSDVYRDTNGQVTTSGGTLDPSTKKVDTTISWTEPYISSLTATEYLTRYLDNLSWIQTTQADFTAGTNTNTAVTNSSGGEVILGAGGGGGDWCIPSKSITTVDLPKSGVANAITAIEGKVFAGTGENAAGISYGTVTLSLTDPPVATLAATFDGYKTNAVFGDNNYAYLATDNHSKEGVILSLSQYSNAPTNSKYLEVGTLDVTGNTNGDSIYVLNDKAYVTANSKLYIFDITTKTGSHSPQNAGLALSGTGKKVIVIGNFAYIATGGMTNQLQIIDVSNPANPSVSAQITLDGGVGRDLFVNASSKRAYVVTAANASKSEFFIVDIDPASGTYTQVKGTYDAGGTDPKGVTVVTGNRAILVGSGGTNQYQVINIANEASPVSCAGLAYATGVNGVASVLQSNGYAYSYIITGDASSELKIILGGAGGQYSSAGIFESSPFDVTTVGLNQTAFNRFDATFLQPPQTTIGFQVAVANAVSGSCTGASYTFIGPGRTSNTTDLYTSGSSVPLFSSGSYTNPGRCFKYKVYFTSSDVTQTPELYDFTVNYSP